MSSSTRNGEGRGEIGSRVRMFVALGVALLHVLALTWRVRYVNRDPMLSLRATRRPFIFAFWHALMLPLLWNHRREGVVVLISSHRDGEIIARTATSLGYRTVRGSTSRGGGRALLGMVRELERGRELAVTPDGPRGPAERFAPGALVAAQRAGVPIVPVAVHASRAWRLRSWDRFMIPKPFARVTIAYGDPTPIAARTAREAESEVERFEQLMRQTAAAAGA